MSAPVLGIQAPSDGKRRYPPPVARHILKLETNKGGNAKDAGRVLGSRRRGRCPSRNRAAPTLTLSFTHRSKRLTPGWRVDMEVNVYIRVPDGNRKRSFDQNREIRGTGPHMTALAEPAGTGKQSRP